MKCICQYFSSTAILVYKRRHHAPFSLCNILHCLYNRNMFYCSKNASAEVILNFLYLFCAANFLCVGWVFESACSSTVIGIVTIAGRGQ